MMRADNPEYDVTRFGAFDSEEMVASSISMLPLHDNLHACSLDVYVPPSRRREGIGTQLLADIEAQAGDYRILTYDTVCPAEQLASFARLLGMMHSEMPTGDLDLHDSQWTTERLRAAENRRVTIGRHVLTALAIAPDGSVAGSSDVRIDDTDGTHGQVGVTLVDPVHRGHRLGLALKIATHDLAMATYGDLDAVDTCNAEANAHMNAVNDALGYRSIETLLELQKKI